MKFATEGLGDYITDPGAETKGITVKLSDDVHFYIRRAGGSNGAYERTLARHSKPYLRRIRNNSMSTTEFRDRVVLPTYVDSVILGWHGVRDEKGDLVEFTPQNCREFLGAFPNVFEELVAIASDMAAFREQEQQEVAESLGES